MGEHHRSDVAPFHHHAGALAHGALFGHQGAPHARDDRHFGGAGGNLGRAYGIRHVLAVEPYAPRRQLDLRGDGELLHAMHVARIDLPPQRPQGHRAVHGAGIDVGESQPRGHAFGDGAFARARRPVDGHHYPLLSRVLQDSRITGQMLSL